MTASIESRPISITPGSVRAEPLRRTLERLDPEAREHFVAGLRILAEEIDASAARES